MAKTKSAPKPTAQLLADYSAFPNDQFVNEQYTAARLGMSRAWLQWKRVAGGGPRFYRSNTGQIRYLKSDIEKHLAATLTAHNNTSEYKAVPAEGTP